MKENKNKAFLPRGFTLIELLIVSGIMSVIALSLYSTLSSGLKIWQRITHSVEEEDINLFLGKLGNEIRNMVNFSGLTFSGGKDTLSFNTIVTSQRLMFSSIGQIRYSYDSGAGIVQREQKDFSHIFNNEEGVLKVVLTGIKAVRFSYYLYDEKEKKYFWVNEYASNKLPLAVKLELELNEDKKIIKTVSIPISSI